MKRVLPLLLPFLLAATPVKNFPLVNQEGRPFQLYDLKGKPVLVSFIFSRCPQAKMCPLTVTKNKQVLELIKKEKTKKEIQFLFVTLDPEFDTPSVLKAFARTRHLDSREFTLATGNPQALSDLASEFNVMGFKDGASVSHNMKTILLGADLSEVKQFKDNEWTAEEVLKALY